jgi:hypothetical protein
VPAALLNILIGLFTSIISGGSVWLWQRGKNSRILRRKASLFGLSPGSPCLIVMTSRYDNPRTSSHHDIQAFIDVAGLANEAGCPVWVAPSEEVHEGDANRTEICIGGPDSNPRTRGHLAAYLPGVTIRPYNPARRDSLALVVGGQRFLRDPGKQEYVLVAKFVPRGANRPVMVVSGQTAITNRAAIHVLKRDYHQITKALASIDRFCIIIGVASTGTYGHQAAKLERDVTELAFAPH